VRTQLGVEQAFVGRPAVAQVEADSGFAGQAPHQRRPVGAGNSLCLVEQRGSGAASAPLRIGSHSAQSPGRLAGQPWALFGKYQAGTEKRLVGEGTKMHDGRLVLAGLR
jgi:hypothetical protein